MHIEYFKPRYVLLLMFEQSKGGFSPLYPGQGSGDFIIHRTLSDGQPFSRERSVNFAYEFR